MSLADELRKLQELRDRGSLTAEEFAAAKAAVLAGKPDEPSPTEHLAEIRKQNEIAQLDREWRAERERYMVVGRHGQRYIPNRVTSAMGGALVVVFGMIWTTMAASMGSVGLFPAFGVIFMLFGIGVSIYGYIKAGEYERAFARYQRRRVELTREERDGPRAGS